MNNVTTIELSIINMQVLEKVTNVIPVFMQAFFPYDFSFLSIL